MSIANEIQRIKTNISNTYDKLEEKGATIPASKNSANLVSSINTYGSDATAVVGDIKEGKTAYVNGAKVTGTMVNNGTLSYTPSSSTQTIPAGYTSGGTISPMDITESDDYGTCLGLSKQIIGGTPYTELTYIESTGTQWINTGVGANASNIKIQAQFLYPNNGQDGFLWSSYNNSSYGIGDLYNDSVNGKLSYYYGSNFSNFISSPSYATNTLYTIESIQTLSQIDTILNGTNTTINRNVNSNNSNLVLFRRGNSSTYSAYVRLYYFKVYINNTLVRDFIPVKDPNNVVCLYDKISNTYFYNEGSGTFIAGGEV